MQKSYLLFLVPFGVLFVFLFGFNSTQGASEYAPISEAELASSQAYETMMSVISHPRCINCHPNDNIPKQGMEGTPHPFGREGATSQLSFDALLCASCHKEENDNIAGQPGAPHWGLAPKSMAWKGLSDAEIAASMLNPENNGNKTHAEILKHLTEDELVLWAFEPGLHPDGTPREKPPVSEEEFIAAVKTWFANGAVIPKK